MRRLNKFCFCVTLQMATIEAAVWDIIHAIVFCFMFSFLPLDEKLWQKISALSPTVVVAANFAFFTLTYLISTLLIIGAIKRNVWLILPWLVLHLMYIIMFLFLSLGFGIYELRKHEAGLAIGVICFGVIDSAMSAYFWAVVMSFYSALANNE